MMVPDRVQAHIAAAASTGQAEVHDDRLPEVVIMTLAGFRSRWTMPRDALPPGPAPASAPVPPPCVRHRPLRRMSDRAASR